MDYGAAIREYTSSVWRTDDFGRLMAQLEGYLPSSDLPSIQQAYELSAKAHEGQRRAPWTIGELRESPFVCFRPYSDKRSLANEPRGIADPAASLSPKSHPILR